MNGTFHPCPKPAAIHTEWNTVVGHTPNTRVSLNHMDLDGRGVRSATKEEAGISSCLPLVPACQGCGNSSQMAWWVLTLTGVDLRTGLPYPENLSCLFITLGSIQMRSDSKRARCQNTPLANVLEKEMATHSSVLAWRIPRAEEPAGLPSMGSHKVRYN